MFKNRVATIAGSITRVAKRAVEPAVRLSRRIADPRVERLTFFGVYLLLGQSGVQALVSPPTSIEGAWGGPLTLAWGLFLTLGGALGALSVLPGWNYVERLAVLATFTGALMYGSVVLILHYTSDGQRLSQLGFVAGWLLIFTYRAWTIRRYAIAPKG